MYVGFNVNSGGGGLLKLAGATATAGIGSSQIAIHAIQLSGGTPVITQPPLSDCFSCSYPCGACQAARFAVDKYMVKVPGPYAVAIHVIDGLATSEASAITGSINDDTYDPAPKQNTAVIGAAVFRGTKQTYVVASSAQDGKSPGTMTYGVRGESASRHIVFDAPEDSNGESVVTATAQNGRCVVSITAGSGFAGRPLLFSVASEADNCKASEATDVPAGVAPPGGGVTQIPGNPNGASPGGSSGCGCKVSGGRDPGGVVLLSVLAFASARRRRNHLRRGRMG